MNETISELIKVTLSIPKFKPFNLDYRQPPGQAYGMILEEKILEALYANNIKFDERTNAHVPWDLCINNIFINIKVANEWTDYTKKALCSIKNLIKHYKNNPDNTLYCLIFEYIKHDDATVSFSGNYIFESYANADIYKYNNRIYLPNGYVKSFTKNRSINEFINELESFNT